MAQKVGMKVKLKVPTVFKLCFAIVGGMLFGQFVSDNVVFRSHVIGDSMNPTYISGETVTVNRLETPSRGDVVVVKESDEKYIIKRCVGMPGDKLQIIEGLVYINDELYSEDYIFNNDTHYSGGIANSPVMLGEDEYFVLGDNRVVSKDSRTIGKIQKSQIVGVVG